MLVSDKSHFFLYLIGSFPYWIAFLLKIPQVTVPLYSQDSFNFRLQRQVNYHLSAVYLLGALTFDSAAMMFVTTIDDFFHVKHISALITHCCTATWNFSSIVLALYWLKGHENYKRIGIKFSALSLTVMVCLIGSFIAEYPGPDDRNYIRAGAHTIPGSIYLCAYAISTIVTKMILLWICLPQLRHARNTIIKRSLIIIIIGSFLLMLSAFARLIDIFPQEFDLSSRKWEVVPMSLLILGGSLIPIGFSLPRFNFLVHNAKQWFLYYRIHKILTPLTITLVDLGVGTNSMISSKISYYSLIRLNRLKIQVHRQLILIMDNLLQANKLRNQNSTNNGTYNDSDQQFSLGSNHLDSFKSAILLAKQFNILHKKGLPQNQSYDEAVFYSFTSQNS